MPRSFLSKLKAGFSRWRRPALNPLLSRAVRTVALNDVTGCGCRCRAGRRATPEKLSGRPRLARALRNRSAGHGPERRVVVRAVRRCASGSSGSAPAFECNAMSRMSPPHPLPRHLANQLPPTSAFLLRRLRNLADVHRQSCRTGSISSFILLIPAVSLDMGVCPRASPQPDGSPRPFPAASPVPSAPPAPANRASNSRATVAQRLSTHAAPLGVG